MARLRVMADIIGNVAEKDSRKGVLLTLGLAFYCAAMLTLATLFIEHTIEAREAGNDALAMQRVNGLFESIEKSARDTFQKTSGITLYLNGSSLVIAETLANKKSSDYENAISSLEAFAESYAGGGISTSMDTTESRSVMSFEVEPYNINITHMSYGGNEIIITPSAINFTSYGVRLKVPATVSCSDNLIAGSDIGLSLEVSGDFNSSCSVSQSVSAAGASWVIVNGGNITINISNSALRVESSLDSVDVELAIGLGNFAGKEPEVYLQDTLSVALTSPAVSKTARVRLL